MKSVGELTSQLAAWDELWRAIKEMEPILGDANKPLAIAASYALLMQEKTNLKDALQSAAGALYLVEAHGAAAHARAALNTRSALSANSSTTMGIVVTPASDNAKPLKCKLQFNKETKKIDRVQLVTGLVMDSFDPPEECDERTPRSAREGEPRLGDVVSGETSV